MFLLLCEVTIVLYAGKGCAVEGQLGVVPLLGGTASPISLTAFWQIHHEPAAICRIKSKWE